MSSNLENLRREYQRAYLDHRDAEHKASLAREILDKANEAYRAAWDAEVGTD